MGQSSGMNVTELAGDILELVGAAVALKHADCFVTSLPFDDHDLRRMRCIVYRNKMSVVYAPTPLPPRLREHLLYISNMLGSESDAVKTAIRLARSRRPDGLAVYDSVKMDRWTNVYVGHETHLYSMKAAVGLQGSIRVTGYVPVMAQREDDHERDGQSAMVLSEPTEGQGAQGTMFRLNDNLFRRVRIGRRLTWIRVGE